MDEINWFTRPGAKFQVVVPRADKPTTEEGPMATVRNPTDHELFVHELRASLRPGEIVTVAREVAEKISTVVLEVELDAEHVVEEVVDAVKAEVKKVKGSKTPKPDPTPAADGDASPSDPAVEDASADADA